MRVTEIPGNFLRALENFPGVEPATVRVASAR